MTEYCYAALSLCSTGVVFTAIRRYVTMKKLLNEDGQILTTKS